jgi:DNA polymerase III subunit delta
MARRLREVLAIAVRLEAGESPAQVKAGVKMAPYLASRRMQEARATDAAALRRTIEALEEIELASRGQSELADDTVALRAIAEIAA